MKGDVTRPVRIDKDVAQSIKEFVVKNGGSMKDLLKHGALWAMTKGAQEYLKKIKK